MTPIPAHQDSRANLRAAALLTLSMLGYGCNDALIKLAASDLPLFESIFIRGVFVLLLVGGLMIARRQPAHLPERGDRGLVALRLVGEVVSMICFLTALLHMPIASVTAVLQATPITITLVAAFALGEKIGWRRYLAIVVGFIGVMILIQPGTDAFSRYSLWALAAVAFLVLRDLCTRRLSAQISSLLVTFYTAVTVTVVAGVAGFFGDWHMPSLPATLMLAAAAGFLLVGYLFGIMAMRIGDIGFVSPFRYSIMLWAILLGVIVFGEIPDATTLLGTAIVAGTGSYAYYREAKSRHRITKRDAQVYK